MKMLHPTLKGYKTLPVVKGRCKVFIKPEADEDSSLLPILADIMQGFDEDGDFLDHELYNEDKYEYLGDGSFSRVIAHPNDATKVIKLMLRYNDDSTCYQYLRLVKTGTIDFDWCPNVYSMGRIKVVAHNSKRNRRVYNEDGLRVVDVAYVVLDRLNSTYDGWADHGVIKDIEAEFRANVFNEYFPYAKIDVRGANVLTTDDGKHVLTDPVWNGDHSEPDHWLPWISKYPQPKQSNLNLLKENITHGRVW